MSFAIDSLNLLQDVCFTDSRYTLSCQSSFTLWLLSWNFWIISYSLTHLCIHLFIHLFIHSTNIDYLLWPPEVKSWLIGKDSDAGRDWGQEEKRMIEDEMAGWHHRLDAHEFGWTLGVGDGQGGLVCCDSWGHKEMDTTERLNWTEWDLTHNHGNKGGISLRSKLTKTFIL